MNRPWIWLQLLLGYVPIWALFVTLLLTGHPGIGFLGAALTALRMILAAAVLGLVVQRIVRRWRWPHPMRPGFVLLHLVAALLFATAWVLLNGLIESAHRRALVLVYGPGFGPFLVLGCWLYAMLAGVAYTVEATHRAARIEAVAAESRLAALRAQLHPHFLFNSLHMIVQLIPREPRSAAIAAERIAALLRTTLEEKRDIVSLAEEWAFVERYLEIERLRFGERLRLHIDLSDDARRGTLPSFALQTLVENAVRHGAQPQIGPTDITIHGSVEGRGLSLVVRDSGAGPNGQPLEATAGSGLKRLRDRLAALYDGRAKLEAGPATGGGFEASLTIPQDHRNTGESAGPGGARA